MAPRVYLWWCGAACLLGLYKALYDLDIIFALVWQNNARENALDDVVWREWAPPSSFQFDQLLLQEGAITFDNSDRNGIQKNKKGN